MAVFVELTTDAFQETFQAQAASRRAGGNRTSGAGRKSVRRPLRGIEIKEDTYAYIKVVRSDGREIRLFDSSSSTGLSSGGYANFMLQQVQEARMEKHQLVETFGDSYIFFFGESPRFIDVAALLLNTHDFNWRAEWWQNYHEYLRGTRLAELGARVYLFYDDIVIEGFIINASASENSMQQHQIPLQFRMYVTNYSNLSLSASPDNANFPIRASVTLPEGVDLTRSGAAEDIVNKYYGQAYDAATAENSLAGPLSLMRTFEEGANPFVSGRKLSDLIRRAPRSIGVSADVWNAIETGGFLEGLVYRQGQALRGKISDNYDEYTGYAEDPGVDFGEYAQQAVVGTVRSVFESADFFRQAIESLSCYGANINNPEAMAGLGFKAEAKASASASASFDAGIGSGGSGLGGTRQPGFKDPKLFTFAGVTDARGAVQRFAKSGKAAGFGFGVSFDASVSVEASAEVSVGVGAGAGAGAGTGPQGAGIGPNGDATAFAFISVDGTLDASGQARSDPAAVQARLNKQKFGFSADNPYGTACPPGGSGGGLTFSLP